MRETSHAVAALPLSPDLGGRLSLPRAAAKVIRRIATMSPLVSPQHDKEPRGSIKPKESNTQIRVIFHPPPLKSII